MMKNKYSTGLLFVGAFLAVWADPLLGDSVYVPNSSFELPETFFADPNIVSWQDCTKPWWYDESGGYFWDQLTGVFLNVPPEDPSHIDNCDGLQAVWLFAVPEVELFQDLAATFEVGRAYHLIVGVIGGGGNMKDGVPIEIRLYYRDGEDNRVTVGVASYTYYWDAGYLKHFNDIQLDIPLVGEADPWAGKNIGVQIGSTLSFPEDLNPETGRAGGFWDLDNVRLNTTLPGPDFTEDHFVNLEDFAAMAQEWMAYTDTTTDMTGEGCVNMQDLMILAQSWLEAI
ncbi:MAG: hypothetical protein JXN61_13690 [Sedimentisphaerales bacterium]|nr:hypothetical protein [Sedimentisphaerales bacterium]